MHQFVSLARKAVEEYVKRGNVITPPEGLPEDIYRKRAGVFVSLKKGNQLRGCIGTFMPVTESIAEEIIRNAISAATQDPRFPAVRAEELDDITYSVDILSEPERVTDISELDPKKYGVIVTKGPLKGLLLPDLEGVDTVDEQLRIARMKAGFSPYDNDVEVLRFTVTRYY